MKVPVSYMLNMLVQDPYAEIESRNEILVRYYGNNNEYIGSVCFEKQYDNDECYWTSEEKLSARLLGAVDRLYIDDIMSMYIDEIDFKVPYNSEGFDFSVTS
jgi:hypothetical protein